MRTTRNVKVAIRVLNANLRLDPIFPCKVKWNRLGESEIMMCTDGEYEDPANSAIVVTLMNRDVIW